MKMVKMPPYEAYDFTKQIQKIHAYEVFWIILKNLLINIGTCKFFDSKEKKVSREMEDTKRQTL